jgi:hypothetical protein
MSKSNTKKEFWSELLKLDLFSATGKIVPNYEPV